MDLNNQPRITGVPSTVAPFTPKTDLAENERYRDSLDLQTQFKSFTNVAKRQNWVYNVLQLETFDREENYELDTKIAQSLLESNQLAVSSENLVKLLESGSSEQTEFELEEMKQIKDEQITAQKDLSRSMQNVAAISGSLLTPEVAGSIGIGLATKMNKVRTILATTGTIEASASLGKIATDSTYTMGDLLFDTATVGLDVGIVKAFNRTKVDPDIESIKAPTENILLLEDKNFKNQNDFFNAYTEAGKRVEIEETELQKVMEKDTEFMEWYKNTQRMENEINKKIQAFDEEAKKSKEAKKYYDDLANMREKAAQYREKIRNEEIAKRELELRNKIEEERILQKFATDPRYDPAVTSKIIKHTQKKNKEFEIQKAKVEKANKNIDVIKGNVKTIQSKLTDLNAKIKNGHKNKGVITKWKKEITALKSKLKQEQNKLSAPVNARKVNLERKELHRLNSMIEESFEDVNDAARFVREEIKTLPKKDLEELKSSIDLLAKNNLEFGKVKTDLENLLKPKHKFEGFTAKKLTRKQKAIIGAVALGGTSAYAGEGDEDGATLATVVTLLIAGLAGVAVVRNLRNSKGKIFQMNKAVEYAEFSSSPKGQRAKGLKNRLFDMATSRLTSTYYPIAKHSTKAKEIIEKLVFNFDNSKMSAEIRKTRYMHNALYEYKDNLNKEFVKWVKEKNISTVGKIVDNAKLKSQFQKEVSDVVEGLIETDSPAVKKMAELTSKQFKDALDAAVRAGVQGAEEIATSASKNYLPRMWRKDNIKVFLDLHPDNPKILEDALSLSMQKQGKSIEEASEQAKELVNWFKSNEIHGTSGYKAIFGKIEDLLKDTVTEDDVNIKLREYKDRQSRLKGRIDLDIRELDGINFKNAQGETEKIDLDDIVKRDSLEIIESYHNTMYGAVAMAEVGYTSKSQIMRAISDDSLSPVTKELEQVVKLIYGEPITDGTRAIEDMVNAAKDVTLFASLPLVVISMIVEVGKTIFNGGFFTSLRNMKNGFNFKRGDALTESLIEAMPLGTSRIRSNFDVRHIESATENVVDIGQPNKLSVVTNSLKEATVLGSGMVHMSDFLHRWNLVNNATRFAKFLQNGKGLSRQRLLEYGIDDKVLAMFKAEDFTFKLGKLQEVPFKTWNKEKQDAFTNILFRLNQEITQEATIGGTPLWMKTNSAGKIVGTLGQYAVNLFNNQGIRDAKHLDSTAAVNLILTLAGSYMSIAARNAVLDREMDDETLMYYSLLNLPQAGLYSTANMFVNPAVVGTLQDIARLKD